jgi:DNA mismatch repair protein MutL
LAKSLACKKSIKANEYHNATEIEYLLDDLRNTENPFTCPHGRPIIIKFDKYEIEKWFKRVV